MTKVKHLVLVSLAGLALAASGCSKKKESEGTPPAGSGSAVPSGSAAASGSSTVAGSAAPSGSAVAGSGSAVAGSGSAVAPVDDKADKLEIFAKHSDPAKPDVTVTFTGVKVVKATFDPAKLEGGTAELAIDVASLSSGVEKRDLHLKNPDYLDLEKFATVSVKVDNVKGSGDAYTADATVNAHGVEKKVPVTFKVAEKGDDWVRIVGEAKFNRLDFSIGKPEAEEGSANAMTAKLTVTLKKS
jgi:polyisoprenoid-binding protein YceI